MERAGLGWPERPQEPRADQGRPAGLGWPSEEDA